MLGGGYLERNQLGLKRLDANVQTDFTMSSNLEFCKTAQLIVHHLRRKDITRKIQS